MSRLDLVFGLIGAAAIVVASGSMVHAQPRPTARVSPSEATSSCLGLPITPQCAADTLIACFARGDRQLCRAVGVSGARPDDGVPPLLIEYLVERVSIIRPEDITDDLAGVDWFKPGYGMVELQRRSCPPERATCADEEWQALQVIARPRGERWEIVIWRSDIEPEILPEIPPVGRE